MAREFAAFISYRHRPLDIAVAMKVHKCIERFKIPGDLRREERKNPGSVCKNWNGTAPEKLLVFRDRDELPLSNDLTSDIFEALDHAKCLIVICTPDTPKSLWVRREISHFIEKHGRKRIITVLAAGTPEESIPREITTRYAEDGVTVLEEYEPLVAFLVDDSQRKVLKNMDKEKLRICAAILGCPYDSLKQRHKRRRMQQALAASAAAFLVALSFIGMLVNRNLEIQAQKREVEAQKLQVEEQKRMTQYRESELLAADARAALEAGNTREAIEKEVPALPRPGEEARPYYAPAEAVLMEAMDVLGGAEEHTLLREMVWEQMTPIRHFCFSRDGSLAVTIDDYGVLHCFDTVTGEEKWSEIVTLQAATADTSYVRTLLDESCLVCQYGNMLEGRELRTGRLLWRYEMRYAATGYFICDDTRNQVAVLKSYHKATEGYLLELEILSAATGAVERNILLEQSEALPHQTIHNTSQTRLPTGGAFSEDGRYFACAFSREHEELGKGWLVCYVADLQEGTVVTQYTREIDFGTFYVSRMELRDQELLISLEPNDEKTAGSLLKLDWRTGTLLWHTTTPAELEDVVMWTSELTSHILFWGNVAFLGRHERLYAIDLETGQLLSSAVLPGDLSSLRTVSDTYFAFSLNEGTYAIGWCNRNAGFTLTTDAFYQVTAPVEEHKLLMPYGGGIVQRLMGEQYLEISVSNIEQPGFLAVVPEANPRRLIVRRPVTIEKTILPTPVTVPVEFERLGCNFAQSLLLPDNTLILGQFYGRDESWTYHYFYLAVDPVTHEVKRIYPTESSDSCRYFFLPDGSGCLGTDKQGKTTLFREDQETVLTEKVDPNYGEDRQISVRGMVQTDSAYLADGTVLTVHSDSETLTILKNGGEAARVELPESHRYSESLDSGVQRFLRSGRNGYAVTCLTWLMQSVSATDVAFCDTATGTWLLPELEAPLVNTDAVAFAETKPWTALVDGSHMVRVLDLSSGTEIAAFSLRLPAGSVLCMDFLLEDSCLMVKTRDADVLIYDIATGEILLQDKLETTFSGTLTARKDPAGRRLYILDSSQNKTNALCVDLDSWTVLARAENILCYIPETNELYCSDGGYGVTEARFLFFRVPDTDTLVRQGQQMLNAG